MEKRLPTALVFLGALLCANTGWSGSLSVEAGAAYAVPMGNIYSTLKPSPEFHLDLLDEVQPGSGFFLRASAVYASYAVKNVATASANVGLTGLFGGFELHPATIIPAGIVPGAAPNAAIAIQSRLSPFFGLQVGGLYDYLSFPSAVGTSTNGTMAFAARALPGIDLWLSDSFGTSFELPVTAVFVDGTVFFWEGSFSLKVRL